MYNGVKAMITAEKELANKNSAPAKVEAAQVEAPKAAPKVEAAKTVPVAVSVKAGPHLKKPEDITGLIEFPEGTKSSLCKFLTKDVHTKYMGKKDKAGVSFE